MLARSQQHFSETTKISRIYDNIMQTIGHTPMVRLSRFAEKLNLETEILAKVEYFNPAGSVKDRAAMAMIEDLKKSDIFHDDIEIIEPTSGNNGVACAWICAIYNIPITIVIPEHMSIERRKLMQLYGATVITTSKELGTKGAIDHAAKLVKDNPNAVSLNQFSNQANVEAHYQTTAREIWQDCQGELDVFVAGIGTGGTITGVAKALKQFNPQIKIVGVEPSACPVLSKGHAGVHKIQGLSSGHVPEILDQSLLDYVCAIDDQEAIDHARSLARVEGLPVGISSGAAMAACIKVSQQKEMRGKRIVTLFADTAERYFSTELFAHCSA